MPTELHGLDEFDYGTLKEGHVVHASVLTVIAVCFKSSSVVVQGLNVATATDHQHVVLSPKHRRKRVFGTIDKSLQL
jgi:hypothetical protein